MSILENILARTRADALGRRAQVPMTELQARCRNLPAPRDFFGALRRESGDAGRRRGGAIRAIAEIKKASPSRGVIRPDFEPVGLARAYREAGAAAVSVLTDVPFFQGSLGHLSAVRAAVELPLLRKDFHLDPYQLWEARGAGADAVLLIAAALLRSELQDLLVLSRDIGVTALVEVHTRRELDVALASGALLIGINNRNLESFEVTLETTFELLPFVPDEVVLVSESGIGHPSEVMRLAAAGVDAILVGEGLLRYADVGSALRRLLGVA
jgi:indole-3-glycerol phosphate synthase